jgi:hypothetical protein
MIASKSTGDWKPLSLPQVVDLFAGAPFPWWVAGGFAVELAIGRPLRSHGDIDVLILRRDSLAVRQFLKKWDCWTSDLRGQFGPWTVGEALPDRAHDIWCREEVAGPWRLDLKVDEAGDLNWHSRRNSKVRLPLAEFGVLSDKGIPYVTPEVLIFYKAKAPRRIDEIDLDALLPILSLRQRMWVLDAIRATYGEEHPWLARLCPGWGA